MGKAKVYGYRKGQVLHYKFKEDRYETRGSGIWGNTKTTGRQFCLENLRSDSDTGRSGVIVRTNLAKVDLNTDDRIDLTATLKSGLGYREIDMDMVEEEPVLLNFESPMCFYKGESKAYEKLRNVPLCVVEDIALTSKGELGIVVAPNVDSIIKIVLPMDDVEPIEVFGDDGCFIEFMDGTGGIYLKGEGVVNEDLDTLVSVKEMVEYDFSTRQHPTDRNKDIKAIFKASENDLFDKTDFVIWERE